jgi:serine/threonine-protein kinase HipA
MATKQYGKVYLHDRYAGILAEEPGNRFVFTYDESYLEGKHPPVSMTLPLSDRPHYCERGLHPYFDNLVAEGWLRDAQARALGVHKNNRFGLLLAFGRDCIGAVSIVDPEPREIRSLDLDDPEQVAALAGRASLSGVQPKMTAYKTRKGYEPATQDLASTHIAKLPSRALPDILELELLTLRATAVLLPEDQVVEAEIAPIGDQIPQALLIKRFDRNEDGSKRHFEEFNQIFGRFSEDKYEGAYEEMGQFIRKIPLCVPAEADTLYRRILAAVLTGNTDAHFKNFAMFHTMEGLRLTPSYDLVAAAIYKEYQAFALQIAGARDIKIADIKPKHLILLGEAYGLPHAAIKLAVDDLGKRLEKAKEAVFNTEQVPTSLKDNLIQLMEKRWNGNFSSIGQHLLKRPSGGAKLSDLLSSD